MSNIRETDKYKIVVGQSTMHQGDDEVECYRLINKETGIVETETTILPQAIEWMEEFTRLLENPSSRTMMDDMNIAQADTIKTVQ